MTDDRLASTAGAVPANPSALAAFLDDHRDAPGFEITYTDGGAERTRLLHTVSLDAVALERPSASPVLACTPVAPGGGQFTVRVDAIGTLAVVEPPPECYTADAETPDEEATGLRRLADANPEAVRVSSLLALLDREDESPFRDRDALRALRRVAAVRPDECTPAIPILRSLLARDELLARTDALATLRAAGETDPGAIAPLVDDLVPSLSSNVVSARREATRCVAAVADEYPEDAVDAVPVLATIVEDGADGHSYAVCALSRITREYPEAVKPVAETLGTVVPDGSVSDGVRLNATAALGRIVGEYPSAAVEIVDDVATLLDADNHKLRNNAVGLIGDVAVVHTDAVEPYAGEIAGLLTAADAYTRVNASAALGRVAEDFPDSVDHATPAFVELLSDDNPRVRENACWALGHLCTRGATAALEERARGDENADVRRRAAWALARIDG